MAEKKTFQAPDWFRLDNAGILFPGQNSSKWSNIFRTSVELKEDVDPDILQKALNNIMPRFPMYAVRMRRGLFWYYLEKNPLSAPIAKPDVQNPCYRVKYTESDRFLFRVYYHGRSISVDFFHAVTDGYGNSTFLFTLVAEYLRLKGNNIPPLGMVKDITKPASKEEMRDAFPKFATSKAKASVIDKHTYIPGGTRVPKHSVNFTMGTMSFKHIHRLAKEKGVTVTEFFAAILMDIHIKRQLREKNKQKLVAVQIPINLRNIYPTETLRNFSICLKVTIDPNLGEYSFDELLKEIALQLRLARDEKKINAAITHNLSFEKNPFIRVLPLFVKDIALGVATMVAAERTTSTYLSNLGPVKLPNEMIPFIEKIYLVPGPGMHTAARCGMATIGDNLVFAFASIIEETDIERDFFTTLVKMGVHVKIESNRK